MNCLQKLLDFLDDLEAKKIYFKLDRCRNEAIMVRVDVPGERWEVEFLADGRVEIEVFKSDGSIESELALEQLFAIHGDESLNSAIDFGMMRIGDS